MTGALPRRALLLAPTGVALLGGIALLALRRHGPQQDPDQPVALPSPLLDRPVPAFSLPGSEAKPGFGSGDLAAAGQPVLINFFASWCIPCVQEMPVLRRLAHDGLPIWGIDFRDKPGDVEEFLRRNGNPYQRIGRDDAGRAGDEFGLDGLPESFLVDRNGVVRWSWAGGLSAKIISRYLDPLLRGEGN